jgi:hypothetical protein
MAETLGMVTGASKKIKPETAIGSLLRAPTIEYVVEDVTRTHHADVYEMKTDDAPVKIMALMMAFRESIGKFFVIFAADQSSITREHTKRIGMVSKLL